MEPDPELVERLSAAKAFVSSFQPPPQEATPEAPVAAEPPLKAELLDTKVEVIDSILKLQTQIGPPEGSKPLRKSNLERMKRGELNKLLGSMTNSAAVVLANPQEPTPQRPTVTAVKDATGKVISTTVSAVPLALTKERAASSLFQLNLLVTKVLELTSTNFKDQLGGTDLMGLTDDVLKARKELEEVLAEIYTQHGPKIEQYLSPVSQYSMIMLSLGTQRALANRANQKKEEPTIPPPRYPSPLPL